MECGLKKCLCLKELKFNFLFTHPTNARTHEIFLIFQCKIEIFYLKNYQSRIFLKLIFHLIIICYKHVNNVFVEKQFSTKILIQKINGTHLI